MATVAVTGGFDRAIGFAEAGALFFTGAGFADDVFAVFATFFVAALAFTGADFFAAVFGLAATVFFPAATGFFTPFAGDLAADLAGLDLGRAETVFLAAFFMMPVPSDERSEQVTAVGVSATGLAYLIEIRLRCEASVLFDKIFTSE